MLYRCLYACIKFELILCKFDVYILHGLSMMFITLTCHLLFLSRNISKTPMYYHLLCSRSLNYPIFSFILIFVMIYIYKAVDKLHLYETLLPFSTSERLK
uniref:Uncharacterized protein n=1 Tax=Schizaphis graminum TaxID=13262 RepID=A0A2S2PRZ0_SCHGA